MIGRSFFVVSVLALLLLSASSMLLLANEYDVYLLQSSERGEADEVIRNLSRGTNVNARGGNGFTPLINASWNGHLEIVKILLSRGADIDLINIVGLTALSAAINQDKKTVVDYLIRQGANININPHRTDGNGYQFGPPLVVAANQNRVDLTKFLLSKGANVNICQAAGKYGLTPLGAAAFNGHAKVIEVLLQKKADVDTRQLDGFTPLMLATKKGFTETVGLLVKARANVNLTDEKGNTPLIMAAEGGYADVVKILLAQKANLSAEGEFGKTALSIAVAKGNTEVVRLLLRAGANPDFQLSSKSGVAGTALHFAATNGQRDAAALLLEFKANKNARNASGDTPLIRAADSYDEENEEGKVQVAELLISNSADVNAVNKLGFSALIYASMRRFEKMAELLIDKGADINIKDSYKSSAMHYAGCNANIMAKLIHANTAPDTSYYNSLLMTAAEKCHDTAILETLINAKVDVNAQDKDGKTALDYAKTAGRALNANFIRSKGGNIGKRISNGLEIISPLPGAAFVEGDTVRLIVEPSRDTPKLSFIGLEEDLFTSKSHCRHELFGKRYLCTYTVPVDCRSWLDIGVIAETNDKRLFSHQVPIEVKKPSGLVLKELKVSTTNSDGTLYIFKMKHTEQIYVGGIYSDGTKRNIEDSGSGTTYESSNPMIARVDSEGQVSPVASGKTEIKVQNSGKSVMVPVVVNIKLLNREFQHRETHKIKKDSTK